MIVNVSYDIVFYDKIIFWKLNIAEHKIAALRYTMILLPFLFWVWINGKNTNHHIITYNLFPILWLLHGSSTFYFTIVFIINVIPSDRWRDYFIVPSWPKRTAVNAPTIWDRTIEIDLNTGDERIHFVLVFISKERKTII